MIIYFCFVLIDLINGYKNSYSRNNVSFGVSIIVFMRIVSIKRGYGMAFMCIVTLKNVFSIKSDYRNFGGMG